MVPLLCAASLAATPYVGAEWRPLSRGDLLWITEGNTTGLGVGGLDGFVRPQLSLYGGAWVSPHFGLQGSIGAARLQTTTWTGEIYEQRHWGVIRPGVDFKFSILERSDPRPIPWISFGPHIDLPSARDTSNGYTEEEQELADRSATVDRVRLSAIGARLGAGVDYGLLPALRVGLFTALDWQRSLFRGTDPAVVTSWATVEAAILLEFHWPQAEREEETSEQAERNDR